MAVSTVKVLVIDASIAGAAGQEAATYPTSKNCRDILTAVLQSEHKMAMTREIQREWNAHQKSFALQWRATMNAKKRLVPMAVSDDIDLRESIAAMAEKQVGKIVLHQAECEIMLKDCHLLEAALMMNKVVISLDDRARKHFKITAYVVGSIRLIIWINPDKSEEEAMAWLKAGAEPEKHRTLGFHQDVE